MKAENETELGIIISEETIPCGFHEVGFKGRVARTKPHVDKANSAKPIQYAKTYRDKSLGFWDPALWIDESTVGVRSLAPLFCFKSVLKLRNILLICL